MVEKHKIGITMGSVSVLMWLFAACLLSAQQAGCKFLPSRIVRFKFLKKKKLRKICSCNPSQSRSCTNPTGVGG